MKKIIKKKENPGNEKLKTELKQIRKDFKKLKKSKKRMQLLWYRTKKEHVALIKDLDVRLKAIKKKQRSPLRRSRGQKG
jgi:division protein CdvB (Snf7/Vps24/ESCRT-III family)